MIEILMYILAGALTVGAYAHTTFITFREVAPRLDRIEQKVDSLLEKKN